MMMIVLRLLSLLGLKPRWHRHFSPRCFSRGVGCRWIRGLRAQNPCAIGMQPVHTRVDSRGLQWTPATRDSTSSDFALVDRVLERLAGLEARHGGSRDLDLLAGLR